jgi:hypothetical protein
VRLSLIGSRGICSHATDTAATRITVTVSRSHYHGHGHGHGHPIKFTPPQPQPPNHCHIITLTLLQSRHAAAIALLFDTVTLLQSRFYSHAMHRLHTAVICAINYHVLAKTYFHYLLDHVFRRPTCVTAPRVSLPHVYHRPTCSTAIDVQLKHFRGPVGHSLKRPRRVSATNTHVHRPQTRTCSTCGTRRGQIQI